jgi:hypothetical protein
MKVKELIDVLKTHDQELDVLCYTEEAGLLADGHTFRLLDIEGVGSSKGERRRGDDDVPTMKFGEFGPATKGVFLHVVGKF